MGRTTDFLVNLRRIIKLHESVLKQIGERFGLSLTEAKIISFLHNNPGKDTAADIVDVYKRQPDAANTIIPMVSRAVIKSIDMLPQTIILTLCSQIPLK